MTAELSIHYLADRPEVLGILARWHHQEWQHVSSESLEDRIARMQNHLGRLQVPATFVACLGEEAVGSAALVEDDMHRQLDLTPWLASVYVLPEHRRRGIGGTLTRRVVDEARTLEFPRLYLFTLDQQSFYSRLGWEVRMHTRHMDLDVTVMEYDLSPGTAR